MAVAFSFGKDSGEIVDGDSGDSLRLFRTDVRPFHAPENCFAGDAEIDDLPDQHEHADLRRFAFGRLARRCSQTRQSCLWVRLERAAVDAVERGLGTDSSRRTNCAKSPTSGLATKKETIRYRPLEAFRRCLGVRRCLGLGERRRAIAGIVATMKSAQARCSPSSPPK